MFQRKLQNRVLTFWLTAPIRHCSHRKLIIAKGTVLFTEYLFFFFIVIIKFDFDFIRTVFKHVVLMSILSDLEVCMSAHFLQLLVHHPARCKADHSPWYNVKIKNEWCSAYSLLIEPAVTLSHVHCAKNYVPFVAVVLMCSQRNDCCRQITRPRCSTDFWRSLTSSTFLWRRRRMERVTAQINLRRRRPKRIHYSPRRLNLTLMHLQLIEYLFQTCECQIDWIHSSLTCDTAPGPVCFVWILELWDYDIIFLIIY